MGSDSTAVATDITDRTPCGHLVPDKVRAARCEMPDVATLGDLAETSKVLSHPMRLKITHALFRNELCVGDLATVLDSPESAVSHQRRLLRGMRLVKCRRAGKLAFYSLDQEHVHLLFEAGLQHMRE